MAKNNDNLLVRGARGHVGKQIVYRKHGNSTVMAKMPSINENLEPSAEQVTVRNLFAEAAIYAKGVIADPELKKEYQKKAGPGRTAYNMAFRDYLKAPVVQSINVTRYTGAVGSIIEIAAKDDFRVVRVALNIILPTGMLLEEGDAMLNPVNRNKWTFTAAQANNELAGSIIIATAYDLPGNHGTLQVTVL